MSSFFAQATHFCILILLVLAILDCTCRAASHFRFDDATGFIFAVRESLSSSDPHIYRVASVSMSIDFRSELYDFSAFCRRRALQLSSANVCFHSWLLYDAFVQAVNAGAVTTKTQSQMPRIWLPVEDQGLFRAGIRVR
jgi:hypothetical protein